MSTFLNIIKSILSVAFMLFKYAFYRAISSFFTGLVLLFIAILMFVTFYQAYMPVVSHVKPVYLQFSSDCQGDSSILCTYPEASVFFTSSNKANEERMLMRGQAYKVFLDLEMPPSPTNEKLGMFMVNVKFLSSKGTVLKSSSRSCMLHYESNLVRLFRTIFYSLPLTLGISEEKQKVELNFFDDYIDDSYNPAVQAKVVIMTKQVEIYSSTLRLQASFTGLRYLIFNWPVLFSCLAILGNFATVTLLYSACVNQFMPNPNATSSSGTQRQQLRRARDVQQPNTASQGSNGRVASSVIARPAASFETVSSNVEVVSSNAEPVDPNVPNIPRTTEPTEENTASTSSEVRKRCYTRIASVKLKFHKKQPRLSHVGQRRIKNVKVTRQDIGHVVQESLNDGDTLENVANQEAETSNNANDLTDLTANLVRDSAKDPSVSLDGIQLVNRCSPVRVGHVRKRRRTDNSNKTKKEPQRVKSTTWRIRSKEMMADGSGRTKLRGNASESMENKPGPSHTAESPAQNDVKSLWENFCIAKNWESLKLPRIRRLGMYLQESMPSVSHNIRHCVSDLELSSVEEKRLSECESPKRSVSASDISSLDSNSAAVISEIYQ